MKALLFSCLRLLEAGQTAALATVLERNGSAPRGAGACMLVRPDGQTEGTVGGGEVERRVHERALKCIALGRSDLFRYRLAPNGAEDIGMVCGGEVEVCCWVLKPDDAHALALFRLLGDLARSGTDAWLIRQIQEDGTVTDAGVYANGGLSLANDISASEAVLLLGRRPALAKGASRLFAEPILRESHAYVFGGGHIARELTPLLARLDFSPVVFDDREAFASNALFPQADRVVLGDFCDISLKISLCAADYAVIMTRGHRYDLTLLTQVLRTPACYIGLIGSRSKIAHTKGLLFEAGFSETDFARVHTPVGLPIHAETPAEIAVSIAAEMILHRSGQAG